MKLKRDKPSDVERNHRVRQRSEKEANTETKAVSKGAIVPAKVKSTKVKSGNPHMDMCGTALLKKKIRKNKYNIFNFVMATL